MKAFKIRNKKTGKFSDGGHNPIWVERGKTWTTVEKVLDSIAAANRGRYVKPYTDDCEIVEYELVEIAIREIKTGRIRDVSISEIEKN